MPDLTLDQPTSAVRLDKRVVRLEPMRKRITTLTLLSLLFAVRAGAADDCEVVSRCDACGAAGPSNLLLDGSFEGGLGDWILVRGGGEAVAEVDAPHGGQVARLQGSWAKLESPPIPYEPGMMFTVSAWLRTEDTRGRVDLWLLAYSDEAGTQNVDEIPLSRYNIVDERRVAVPMEPDADWHHYSARTLRLPPIARSFRIALRHRGLDSGGTNQTYMDDVQVRRVWEYEATLDPDFERIRHHAESESDWFAGNTDWSVYWGGGPVWPEHFETSRASPAVWEAGQLELEGTAAVVSRMIPYGGDAIRVELSYSMDRVAHSGEERTLAYLVGFAEDEYATHIPLLRDNGSSGARNRVLSIGDATHQIPEAQCVDHLQIWLVNSPSTSGTVTFDRVSLTLQRDEPAGGDYLIDRSQADVTVDLSSRGVPFQPPAMGFNASYARSIVGVYRQAGFESAAAPAQSPDPDIRPVRAFD